MNGAGYQVWCSAKGVIVAESTLTLFKIMQVSVKG
jgi:hypothetical protein